MSIIDLMQLVRTFKLGDLREVLERLQKTFPNAYEAFVVEVNKQIKKNDKEAMG